MKPLQRLPTCLASNTETTTSFQEENATTSEGVGSHYRWELKWWHAWHINDIMYSVNGEQVSLSGNEADSFILHNFLLINFLLFFWMPCQLILWWLSGRRRWHVFTKGHPKFYGQWIFLWISRSQWSAWSYGRFAERRPSHSVQHEFQPPLEWALCFRYSYGMRVCLLCLTVMLLGSDFLIRKSDYYS